MGSSFSIEVVPPTLSLPSYYNSLLYSFKDTDSLLHSDIKRMDRILSHKDTLRLINMQALYVNCQGKLLTYSNEKQRYCLAEKVGNGFIPLHAMLPAPYSCLVNKVVLWEWRDILRRPSFKLSDGDYVRGELSAELSNYIWPLDQDAIRVQLRVSSHIPCYPPLMEVVFCDDGGGDDGGNYLRVCTDGTTVCNHSHSGSPKGSHIWTVYLFDPPSEGELHLGQRLRRRGSNVESGLVINQIGGNFNGPGGTQNIESTNVHIS